MGDSGFYLNDTQNVVFADNIRVGQMTTPLQDKEIIIGTPTTPIAATLVGNNGVKVDVVDQNIEISLDATTADDFIDNIVESLTDEIADALIEDVLDEMETNPDFTFSRAYKIVDFDNVIQCNGLFTSTNINTLDGGTEVCNLTIKPFTSNGKIVVSADIIASRTEGTIVLALVKEGDDQPIAYSYGYSASQPNLCSLRTTINFSDNKPITLSLRVGGLESGVVIVNGNANGSNILDIKTKSSLSALEISA